MLARVLDRLVGERDIYKRAQDRALVHGQERWDDGYACAKEEHARARTEWVRDGAAHVEEMEEMEERLEEEVARNHRLQEALAVAVINQ